ncbi:MAG: hypothetical protein EWV49_12575, partial [Microcystis aeruginosa Ma_QC_Ch_20071001_S25]
MAQGHIFRWGHWPLKLQADGYLYMVGGTIDILTAVKRTVIPKPHDLGFCFFPLRGSAPALTDLLCSGL